VQAGEKRRGRSWVWLAAIAGLPLSCAGTGPAVETSLPVLPASAVLRPAAPAPVGSAADTTCFRHATPWQPPEEVLLTEPARRYGLFGIIHWRRGGAGTVLAARNEVQRRLGLDSVDFDGGGVRLRKGYGRRLTLLTTTGLGPSAEDALEAEFRLWRAWYLRSETREQGETFMELRREILFR
jgi:hypothetical protein